MLESFRDWILPRMRREYPAATCEITKRALLFEFGENSNSKAATALIPASISSSRWTAAYLAQTPANMGKRGNAPQIGNS